MEEALEDVIALTIPSNAWEQRAFKKAHSYYTDWKLHSWVGFQNTSNGVAPTTNLCLHQRQQYCAELHDDVKPTEHVDCAENRSRKWAQRWRRKGSAKIGRIRVRGALPHTEMQSQAANISTMNQELAHFGKKKEAPQIGPFTGPNWNNHPQQRHPNQSPKRGPKARAPKLGT